MKKVKFATLPFKVTYVGKRRYRPLSKPIIHNYPLQKKFHQTGYRTIRLDSEDTDCCDELFYLAIKDNDIDAINDLIESGCVDVSAIFRQHSAGTGCGILRLLMQNNHATKTDAYTTLSHLIRLGARTDLKSKSGELPIHEACRYGNFKAVVLLLSEHPECKNAKDNRGRTPLHTTLTNFDDDTSSESLRIVEALIRRSAEVNAVFDGLSCLHLSFCLHKINSDTVKVLLDAGDDVNATTHDGRTALNLAACNCSSKTVKLLLDYGSDPNLVDNSGKAPLWWAVYFGSVDTTHALVAAGADVNFSWKTTNKSLLETACERELYYISKFLIESGSKLPHDVHTIKRLLKYAMTHYITLVKSLLIEYYPIHDDTQSQELMDVALNSKNVRLLKILHLAGAKFDEVKLAQLALESEKLWELQLKLSEVPRLKHLCCLRVRRCLGFGIHEKLLNMTNRLLIPGAFVDHITLLNAMKNESDVY